MDLQNLQEIQDYLQRGEYPSGLDKGEKANFRRKCKNNFKFEDGVLYYRKHLSKAEADQDWRVCVRSLEDKARIIKSCHAGPTGGHFGRDKTLDKISSRFFWKHMVEEIRDYVSKCPECQKMNAAFVKTNAKLHPIRVEPKVWHQV